MQDLSAADKLQMQHLYEDSTVALARAVAQLSAALTAETAALEAHLKLVEPPDEEEEDGKQGANATQPAAQTMPASPFSSLESESQSEHSEAETKWVCQLFVQCNMLAFPAPVAEMVALTCASINQLDLCCEDT